MIDATARTTPAARGGGVRAARRRGSWRGDTPLLLMALPGIVALLVFSYLPMIGVVIAFKDYRAADGFWDSRWVGLQNFRFLFDSNVAWRITRNTLTLNAAFIATTLIASLAIALLLHEVRNRWLLKFYQSALFLPYFISWVIVGYFGYALLNTDAGVLNQLLRATGNDPIRWYSSPQYWPAILTVVNLWKGVGFWSVVYLAGILAINPEIYEAARIDGASKWQQIARITIPLLAPLIVINLLLSIGHIFYADFGLFYNVTQDSPVLYRTTDVIDTYVYRALRTTGDIGMAAAAGFYQATIGFILVIFANWVVRRADGDKALF